LPENNNPPVRPAPRVSGFNQAIIAEFRANGGRVGGPLAGAELVLLTTVGAKTGLEQTSVLGLARVDDRLLVVASAGGAPRHPAWYHNVLAHPMARVELGAETFGAVAIPLRDADRDDAFARILAVAPGFADYQRQVARTLPVVALERAFSAEPAPDSLADKLIEIHSWLREQLARVRGEAEAHFAARAAAGRAPAVRLNLRLRQHCLAFCESLALHHAGEDAGLLPELDRRHPDLHDTIERLRAEHRVLAQIRAELEALLDQIDTAEPTRFRTELDQLSERLIAHLDHEEATLLPALG
jgi:deazaflavin-dependent oxidoreductase (nitroreductase family)